MRGIRQSISLGALAAAIAGSVSCGDVVRQGRSPVYLVIDSLQGIRGKAGGSSQASGTLLSDVLTLVTSPAPCSTDKPCPTIFNDMGSASFHLSLKDVTSPTAPNSNNAVTLTRYHVAYRRADGHNTEGVDVPYAFDGAATATVTSAGGSIGFELVRHIAKEESPLVQLVTSPTIITTIADVTFYGTDQVGNDINVTGSIQIDFGNFGDQ
jgi:hypothetical protein